MTESSSYENRIEYDRTVFFFRLAFLSRNDPIPQLDNFNSTGRHGHSTFSVNGRRWRCFWKHNGTSTPTFGWDDGWWPTFETPSRKRWLRQPWISLWGRGRISEAIDKGEIPA